MLASDIAYKHIGRQFRSITYPSKNKTQKPRGKVMTDMSGNRVYVPVPHVWTLTSFQFFDNGNIIVNTGQYYLHADTEVDLLDGEW